MDKITKKHATIFEILSRKGSKIDLIKNFGNLTMRQIVVEKPAAIGKLRRLSNAKAVERASAMLFADLSGSFAGELSREQILELNAELHHSSYRNLSLEDLYLICRRIKVSDVYGKLTINKVLRTIDNYWNEKQNEAAKYHYNKHLAVKEQEPAPIATAVRNLLKK